MQSCDLFSCGHVTLGCVGSPESAEESDADKAQGLNTSGSSAPSSEYSPSQASTISSNPPGPRPAPPTATQEATPPTHWASR